MGRGIVGGLPARLEGVRVRFETWRRTRTVRSPIPETLWNSAVTMAGLYGLNRTARALRVNYYSLKKRIERDDSAAGDDAGSKIRRRLSCQKSVAKKDADAAGRDSATFIELPSTAVGSCECLVEVEDGRGAKMRVRLHGLAMPDLAALGRSFWQRGEA